MIDNRWWIYKNNIAKWKLRIHTLPNGRDMLALCKNLVVAAYETEIGLFSRPDRTPMSCDDVVTYLEEHYLNSQIVDFFNFSLGHMRTRSKIAYAEDGEIADIVIADLKELMLRDRAEDQLRHIPRVPREALTIFGFQLEYGPGPRHFDPDKLPSIDVDVSTSSDIWLPWVPIYDDMGSNIAYYDNRPLASRHSTRLNRFLAEALRLCGSGGELSCLNMAEEPWIDPMIGPEGVRMIEAPPPVFS